MEIINPSIVSLSLSIYMYTEEVRIRIIERCLQVWKYWQGEEACPCLSHRLTLNYPKPNPKVVKVWWWWRRFKSNASSTHHTNTPAGLAHLVYPFVQLSTWPSPTITPLWSTSGGCHRHRHHIILFIAIIIDPMFCHGLYYKQILNLQVSYIIRIIIF